ncbi:pilus assembly protein [Arenimonas terrae]|uniref:Pilus assembly protein n=1 Tax=Arenimonas terrae TaxID=2546226 RepID=A0A5C4RRL8_9GAMM|nr:PilC/PilY family type IV pilus protein [Arenimonas terrae]TNJ33589.1 pilus assembly protein [Arenimonas terrae]
MNANRNKPLRRAATPLFVAFVATLGAAPVTSVFAQSFPQYPLQTGAGEPAPNILFILDDSGSMEDNVMVNQALPTVCRRVSNGDCASSSTFNISNNTFTSNTLMYDPRQTYQTWVQADGTRMTGGTSYSAAYTSDNFASGDTTDLSGSARTFYVPKWMVDTPNTPNNTTNYLRESTNYYRYEIRNVDGTMRSIRTVLKQGTDYGAFPPIVSTDSGTVATWTGVAVPRNSNSGTNYQFDTDDTYDSLVITLAANNGNANLQVYRRVSGNWQLACSGANGAGSNETCTISNAPEDDYLVYITTTNAGTAAVSNLTINVTYSDSTTTYQNSGCSAAASSTTWNWAGCTEALPPQPVDAARTTIAAEMVNFATWYSYHRTRMKIAKAGAAEAFNSLGNNVRVGFWSLHENNSNTNFNIPVGTNDGLFTANTANRTNWFSKLFNAQGNSGTPLRSTLREAGAYFGTSDATGPYGPEAAADQLACRQNFAILTTDGYWNSDWSDSNVTGINDQEGTAGASIIDHSKEPTEDGYNAVRYSVSTSEPYVDGASTNREDTLADIAMRYWKNDLRTDLDNIVTPSVANPAFWQHMVTFGISIGLKGTVDQTTVADVVRDGRPRVNGNPGNWPDPQMSNTSGTAEIPARIDDLLHAAVNGHGEFITATNASAFRSALEEVLGAIQSRLASGSNVATNAATFAVGTRMYQATYQSGLWYGDLLARNVTEAGISSDELWRVSEVIAAGGTTFQNRTVLTWGGTTGTAFPTSTQSTALARVGGIAPVTGANNAAYVKGNQSLEISAAQGNVLRNRVSPLGDVINSSPVFSVDTQTIFVGANDGMLHGINSANGQVQFSYVPAGINLTHLASLSHPDYEHAFFVDGPIALGGDRDTTAVNYLVGTLGRGGKGAFALEVNQPGSMGNGDVLWDHTATTDADMGYVIGVPLIARGNNGDMLAFVPNGIDSTNGSAALFVYNLTSGTLVKKIVADSTGGNGLAAPRGRDDDGDGRVDYVYAGDLLGNVWKFDTTDADPTNWALALGGEPLFTATDPDGNPQPITAGLALAQEQGEDSVFVAFGTGRLITVSDVGSTEIQSIYAIIDEDEVIADRSELTEREIMAVGEDSQGRPAKAYENFSELADDSKGWFIDMDEPTPGERIIGGAQITRRAVLFSSAIPLAGEGCDSDGSGYLTILDVFTGTSFENLGGTGSQSGIDVDGDGQSNDETITGEDGESYYIGSVDLGIGLHGVGGLVNNGSDIVVCGSNAQCDDENLNPGGGSGSDPKRTSWRELVED